jgi:hypothetical protein
VAHASNRDEKCVMRKWCRWCCFSWVASMYTYIYVCSAACQHCWQASNIYIYIYLLVSCMPALLASRTYIYIHIFIYLSMVVQTYIYIHIYVVK